MKEADQGTSQASALTNQKNPYNRDKAKTYEGHETGNRSITAYLCT